MKIVTRKRAISEGFSTYFTGKPCKVGHIALRYVANGCCKECVINGVLKERRIIRAARKQAKMNEVVSKRKNLRILCTTSNTAGGVKNA